MADSKFLIRYEWNLRNMSFRNKESRIQFIAGIALLIIFISTILWIEWIVSNNEDSARVRDLLESLNDTHSTICETIDNIEDRQLCTYEYGSLYKIKELESFISLSSNKQARAISLIAFASLFSSWIGIYLIYTTWKETRVAAQASVASADYAKENLYATQNLMKVQTRAYTSTHSINAKPDYDDNSLLLFVNVSNTGITPSSETIIEFEITTVNYAILDSASVNDEDEKAIERNTFSTYREIGTLTNGKETELCLRIKGNREEFNVYETVYIFVTSHAIFSDVHGDSHKIESSFEYTGIVHGITTLNQV